MSRKRTLVLTGIVVAVGACALTGKFIIDQINAPHNGVVTYSNQSASVDTFDAAPQQVTGTYVSFQYPQGLSVRKNNPISPPDLEQFNYFKRDVESWNLAIDVRTQPGGVTMNSGYMLRKSKPTEYKESQTTINGLPIVIMTDTTASGFSKVAFLGNGSQIATVSLYGNDGFGTKDLSTTFNMVLNSWKWK